MGGQATPGSASKQPLAACGPEYYETTTRLNETIYETIYETICETIMRLSETICETIYETIAGILLELLGVH